MGINTLEQDNSKVNNYGEKGNVVEGDELLPQLIVHVVEEMFVRTFMQKLASGERFQHWVTQKASIVFKK